MSQLAYNTGMKKPHWQLLFPAFTIILLGWQMWAIHDRFIPIQEGWMQYYSLLTQKGMEPYKDFYYFTQPIPLLIVQLISKLGDGYLWYRYYGMIERIIMALALYHLISRHFSPTATFIAVITSAFVYQSFSIDILYTYYQTTLLFFLLSLISLQRAPGSRNPWLYYIFVGLFASLAFFTKQSNGLFISVIMLFMMLWSTPLKQQLLRVFAYILGWAIPASFLVGWLIKEQLISAYFTQVFGGASSKGSILDILFGFWGRNFAFLYLNLLILMILIFYMLWRMKVLAIRINPQASERSYHHEYLLLLAYPLFILAGFLIPIDSFFAKLTSTTGNYYQLFFVYFPFYLLMIPSLVIGIGWILQKQVPISKPLSELILASFVWTYATGLSGQLELYATFSGTALVLAFLFDRVQINFRYFRYFLIALSCLVLFICVVKKNTRHYDWWGWTEFGHRESVASIIPAFRGFKLSPKTVEIYDGIYQDILDNTAPEDTVYTYPFISLFNYVTGRLQPTFAPVHYFDVCPDVIASKDAEALLENPPKMIIYMQMPPVMRQAHEEVFRNGQPSGQRDIDAAIHELIREYNYKKIDAFRSPGWQWLITVWLKP